MIFVESAFHPTFRTLVETSDYFRKYQLLQNAEVVVIELNFQFVQIAFNLCLYLVLLKVNICIQLSQKNWSIIFLPYLLEIKLLSVLQHIEQLRNIFLYLETILPQVSYCFRYHFEPLFNIKLAYLTILLELWVNFLLKEEIVIKLSHILGRV